VNKIIVRIMEYAMGRKYNTKGVGKTHTKCKLAMAVDADGLAEDEGEAAECWKERSVRGSERHSQVG
jgi:hypothetical protein